MNATLQLRWLWFAALSVRITFKVLKTATLIRARQIVTGGIVGAGDNLSFLALVHVLAKTTRSKAEATWTDAETTSFSEDAFLVAGAGSSS